MTIYRDTIKKLAFKNFGFETEEGVEIKFNKEENTLVFNDGKTTIILNMSEVAVLKEMLDIVEVEEETEEEDAG